MHQSCFCKLSSKGTSIKNVHKFLVTGDAKRAFCQHTGKVGGRSKQDLLHIYSIVLTKLKCLAALMQRAMKPSNNISEMKDQPLIVTV